MSMWKSLILVAGLAASTSAVAAPTRLTDTQFLQLSRCRALVASAELGGGDLKAIDAVLKSEGRGREPYITDKAQSLQDEAVRAARHPSADRKARLIAERDGVCQSLMGPQTSVAGGTPAKRAVN
ncbi:MAG: hypothetical protein JSR86_12755 [Proteobacteria bacterium]|nr:hypothetical protein [Pseudomonadota bacterium]